MNPVRGIADRPPRASLTVALTLVASGYALASLWIMPRLDGPVTTYATSVGTAVILVLAGIGLIAVGLAQWFSRPGSGRIAALPMIAGVAWLAPVWVGWVGGPHLARSVGAVIAPLLLPAVAHLALAYPSGRLQHTGIRLIAALGWIVAGAVTAGLAAVYRPLQDLRCWSNCSDNNVFLISPNMGFARALDVFWLWFSVVFAMAMTGVVVWRLVTASPAWRSTAWVVAGPASVALIAETAYAGALIGHSDALLANPVEPSYGVFMALFLIRATALTLLAAGLSWTIIRESRRRAAVARLADDLGAAPPPGSLQAALVRSLGDESIRVSYWLPSTKRWVDSSGLPMADPANSRRPTVKIQRGGVTIAAVNHDPALTGTSDLADQIGAAARLAIDNERLRAEVLAQLERVRASRGRIVAAGDAARRRLERDLHDGAQQRLLAASYQLRLARASTGNDTQRSADIDRAVAEAKAALVELRDLAHGIFPAVLDDAGLGPALWELSASAPIAVDVNDVPDERYPPSVERAAYLMVAAAIEHAHESSDTLHVAVTRSNDILTVDVTGAPESSYTHIADRVGATGGTLVTETRRLRAELPCE